MGFRQGAYCKIWQVRPDSDTKTSVRLSISRKNKFTGEYDQEFSGFVSFVGTACASKAAKLKEGDRIRLGDIDVQNRFDKEKNVTYFYPKVFSFEMADEPSGGAAKPKAELGTSDDFDTPF